MRRQLSAGRRTHAAALVALLLVMGPSPVGSRRAGAQQPEPAPLAAPLTLPDRSGQLVSLASLRGRVVLLDFWATWCVPCRQSLPAYEGLLREYRSRGLEVLAVSVDADPAVVERYLKVHPLNLRVLLDPKQVSARAFRTRQIPSTYFIDRDGYVRSDVEGFHPGNVPEYRKVIEQLLDEPAAP